MTNQPVEVFTPVENCAEIGPPSLKTTSLVGAGVDVLAVHSVFHQSQVIVSREREVGHAAQQASHVLPVCVQSDLFHATYRGRIHRKQA